MIVLDESIDDERLIAKIKHWYQGQAISIKQLRPTTLIKDESIPMLLLRVPQPTFITINVDDFWHAALPHARYCIIAATLEQEHLEEFSIWLRRAFRLPALSTKTGRMGKIVLLTPTYIAYYGIDRQTTQVEWPR